MWELHLLYYIDFNVLVVKIKHVTCHTYDIYLFMR